MADATISHLGIVDGGSPATPLAETRYAEFEEIFTSEVMTAFAETHVFTKDTHFTRTIDHGKSARFPATWKATARFHTPGTPVLGSNRIASNHRTINIDGLLLADVFVDDLEDAMNHFEVRQIFSAELGQGLSREWDSRVAQTIVNAARATATVAGGYGGATISHADMATDSAVLVAAIFDSNRILDEKDVPDTGRRCALSPVQYYMLVQDEKVQNTRFGGHGLMMRAEVPYVGPTSIIKTNNMPRTNITAATPGERNDYTGDFTKVVAAVWQQSAVGTVKLKDLQTQMTAPNGDFNAMYQGTLMLGKYAVGHGILRPECGVELARV
jgi:hypothetical protein